MKLFKIRKPRTASRLRCGALLTVAIGLVSALPASAAQTVDGQVLGGGAPINGSTVTLWAASASQPVELAQARTGADGRFKIAVPPNVASGSSLYMVAQGGQPKTSKEASANPAIALVTILGAKAPPRVTINEMTTVASVWTNAQFLNGTNLRGHALGLKIAAGNVPSFVDLSTGGWGGTIQDPLNGGQTPTMANFATLANLLAGCVTRVTADACPRLFDASTPPEGAAPADTLAAAEAIARYSWYQPKRLFALLDAFYPVPKGMAMRVVPYMPYLNFSPSAWVLPLKYTGGGFRAGGKGMFDSQGNLWVGNNFTVGWQAQDVSWQGNATKFDPNGKPLSPSPTGFTGGDGIGGPGFGTAIDAKDNAWFTTYASRAIKVLDKNGNPLTPPGGITFGGKLGLMQGVIVTPSGDVWALGVEKNQLVHFPKGDLTKGRLVCEGASAEPCKSFRSPFHLAIDQQDRIWVGNGASDDVVRFPASDPSKAEKFKVGYSVSGLGIDSQGNVWVTNRLGSGATGLEKLAKVGIVLKTGGNFDKELTYIMFGQKGGMNGGSVTLLRPDGSEYPGSPFKGENLPGPWAAAVAGDDTVWISNFAGASGRITHLCGAKTENCPPGMKTGDPISPPGGYVGGGLQMETDIGIGPAGDVWVMDNWQIIASCFENAEEALSTLCGGDGVTVFHGMAKPVRAPQIGPARGY